MVWRGLRFDRFWFENGFHGTWDWIRTRLTRDWSSTNTVSREFTGTGFIWWSLVWSIVVIMVIDLVEWVESMTVFGRFRSYGGGNGWMRMMDMVSVVQKLLQWWNKHRCNDGNSGRVSSSDRNSHKSERGGASSLNSGAVIFCGER